MKLLLMFCFLLGVATASSQTNAEAEPSSCFMIPPMGEVERGLTKISETLELIADRLPDITACTGTQLPANACSTGSGAWSLVARIDMTDPNQQCPNGFSERNGLSNGKSLRLCGRSASDPTTGCISTTFNIAKPYTQIRGRIVGYQYGAPFAFYGKGRGIEGPYVDGFSLTRGQPREHIWTFACGSDDVSVANTWVCPCTSNSSSAPSFVGEDYFCETANHARSYTYSTPFYDHPLWDGEECGGKVDCCNFHNPPQFCKTFPTPSSDPIELRQCNVWPEDSDTPFELLELWVR